MAVLKHCVWLLFAAGNAALTSAKTTTHNFTQTAIDNGDALTQLSAQALEASKALNQRMGINSTCTPDKLRVRKEWRTIPAEERKAYVAAVKCLQSSPNLLNSTELPSAKSLYDDFVLTHLNQTGMIHITANFLLWHRYFTWTYEENLRNVCGYTGTFPYWEWGFDVEDPAKSPVFDGSETSMGSNGAAIEHEGMHLLQSFTNTTIILEPGSGGGCVETGPFSDMVVHVGPRLLWQYGTTTPLTVDKPTDDHPRCLKRDLNKHIAARYSSLRNTTELILGNDNIEWFQAVMQGDDRYTPGSEVGIHGGGHYTIGGDPGADPFISPGEPAFFLHHAQIDRVYWIWQMLDFANRQDIFGTRTLQNNPPSANATLDDLIDIAPIGGSAKLRDLMNTVGGSPFCYVYE
ncbi:tyrosinase central domain-containing protein [Colletotrichum costaricense]|uniref:Tyrosinase central domain-containing protein n=1 Tax=Colletotrichum costaricense TaxID=1209916 RepID=A0AAJ0E7W8_9PEZI|nr:tyrosinase central domain-containing protein [Colletotrichum costaricense]KAK1539956.1 tyrosinase central domain-containing protein [Colletotrichum costaricense]